MIVSTGVSLCVAYYVAETYYFDRLFYKKSSLHGYHKQNTTRVIEFNNSRVLEKRIKDLRFLISLNNQTEEPATLNETTDKQYKIAVIGDSITYGLGVRQQYSFPRVLERKLNKYAPTRVFVLAQSGDNMLEHFAKFLLAKENLSPDLYIIAFVENDLLINSKPKYPNQKALNARLSQSCLKPEFIYQWPNKDISLAKMVSEAHFPSIDESYANICYFKEVVKEIAKDKVVFYNLFGFHDPDTFSYPHNLNAVVINNMVEIITTNGGFVVERSDIPFVYTGVSKMEGHPSKKTHMLYADSLFKEIITNPKYDFPK